MAQEANNQEMIVRRGMANVVAATTRLGHVDGVEGKLWYCGYDVIDLAQYGSYEETLYLLLHGELPTSQQRDDFQRQMGRYRRMNPGLLRLLCNLPGAPTPMEALRTVVSAMSAVDPSPMDKSRQANVRRAMRIIAQLPTIVAAHWRLRQGEEAIPPREELGHAANFYYMLHGHEPGQVEANVLDMCLTLMAEHELNASTFAVRVVASTLSDLYAAFTAGLGALNGPLHGAANTEVMKMLLEVQQTNNIDGFVQGALTANWQSRSRTQCSSTGNFTPTWTFTPLRRCTGSVSRWRCSPPSSPARAPLDGAPMCWSSTTTTSSSGQPQPMWEPPDECTCLSPNAGSRPAQFKCIARSCHLGSAGA